ncbi:NodT family efflux transporter outer membrane factor (OMF) lipoprotein [Novosphingobium sp. PhB165]|uniref:efflux transporter outer membrane subunit n=1 Tax=Novosphingobium sp. PhB165 TaxID=2485105 RepID=UPI00104F0582|nr:TolC family protein [Novosphingobium sp. PhB165]TCM12726.1 NodT family efflux transporter outer membrane factor (OMF) lipoprotein [Novosphingobium sp. PhB165]
MRAQTATTTILLAVLLSGCAVGPNYHRPAAESDRATFIGDAAVAERQAAQSADLARWWEGFNDPLLTALISQAQDRNLDVAQSLARVRQAKAGLNAATAALLPSGSVQASAGHLRTSQVGLPGAFLNALGQDRDLDAYEGDIVASWELDIFGSLRRGHEAASADYEASEAGVIAARLAVAAQVADTYVTIRGLQERIAIAKDQVDTQQKLVSTVQLQYRKGVAAELQLRQSEGVLAQVQGTVPVLETGLDAAMNALDVLMGAEPGTYRAELADVRPIPAAPSIADAGGPADLLRRRPDLIIAERRLASSNAHIGQAISEYFPKFSLSGLLGTASSAGTGKLFTGTATQGQGFFGLRWRLFDFGRVDAEIKAAKGANAEALASYRLAVLRASEDVEDSFSSLVKREEQERVLARGETSLVRARDASDAAYKGGVVSLIEVLDADTRLLQTRDQRAQAQTEAARAAISSFRALGGGWNAPTQIASK